MEFSDRLLAESMQLEFWWNKLPARSPSVRGVHEKVGGLRTRGGRVGSPTEQARGLFHPKINRIDPALKQR